ncbi:hypothetical protein J6590_010212 [Homalodisca vitripennis]|nr:hypothetical protein J6590_010212 [Homalodisca vitripennis]
MATTCPIATVTSPILQYYYTSHKHGIDISNESVCVNMCNRVDCQVYNGVVWVTFYFHVINNRWLHAALLELSHL